MTAAAPAKAPETILQLLLMLVRQMLLGLLWKLPLSLLMGAGIWLFHTVVLVYFNEGFWSGDNIFCDWILVLNGRFLSGTFFWGLFMMLVFGLLTRLLCGPVQFFSDLAGIPEWIRSGWSAAGGMTLPLLALGAVSALFVSVLLSNFFVSVMLTLLALSVLSVRQRSFLFLVFRLALSDLNRLLRRKVFPAPARLAGYWAMLVAGSIPAFAGGAMLTIIFYYVKYSGLICGFFVFILLMVALALALVKQMQGAPLLLALAVSALLLTAAGARADDGGWAEAGSSFTAWITSDGAIIAVAMGGPAAAAGVLGALLGLLFGGGLTLPTLPETPPDFPPELPPDAPREPRHGDVDADGDVYDETQHAWIDRRGWEQLQQTRRDNVDWQERERQKIEQHRLEVEQRMEANRQAAAQRAATDKQVREEKLRSILEDKMRALEKAQASADKAAWWANAGYWGVNIIQVGADFGVNTLSNLTPWGKAIKRGYTVLKGTAGGFGQAYSEGGNYTERMADGTVKGVTSMILSEGLGKITPKFGSSSNASNFASAPLDQASQMVRDAIKDGAVSTGVGKLIKDPINNRMFDTFVRPGGGGQGLPAGGQFNSRGATWPQAPTNA